MATVTVFYALNNSRSRNVANMAYRGLSHIGENVVFRSSENYHGVTSDYAVFYGLSRGLDKIFADYKKEATAIYVDLGYWHRRINGRFNGYHKMVINSRHPTAYFQDYKHDSERFNKLGIPIHPWKKCTRSEIIIAGMSAKAANAEGIAAGSWEKGAITELRQFTRKTITYRPKPSCRQSRPLRDSNFDKSRALSVAFKDCHALVTRQSNTAVEAVLEGVPVFTQLGVASAMGLSDLSFIETPIYPEGREQWAADIAWCQFTPAEMASGLPFLHFKNEDLIP